MEETTRVEETKEVDTQTTEQNEEKTFTQKEVNTMIQERLAKEKKKYPSQEELKEFTTWKESQKTETEKYQEILNENTSLKTKLKEYEDISIVRNSGVESKFEKFVYSEVKDMEGNIEDNIKDYLEKNPQYLKGETKETKSTGFSQKGISQPKSEEQSYLDNKYKNNPYYKQK